MDARVSRIDPEILTAMTGLPELDLADLEAVRASRVELMTAALDRYVPDPRVTVTDMLAPGLEGEPPVRLRIYRSSALDSPQPCLYWVHGGGHVMGHVEQQDPMLQRLVLDVGCVVVSVDWRWSPEHPFPAEVHDSYAGLLWVHREARRLGVDSARIVVGGSSSGGGTTAGLALLARDRGEVTIALQLLMAPMLDDRTLTRTRARMRDQRLWNDRANATAWRAYLGDVVGTDDVSEYAAPARASDLGGLPPAHVAVGELDLFVDECIVYAQRLSDAGVATELHVYPGAPHGFDVLNPDAAVSRRWLRDRNEALMRAFLRSRDPTPAEDA